MTTQEGFEDIVLTFAWNDAIEELYGSWHRQVATAKHVHRITADRLMRRHAVVGILVVLATTIIAAGAFASLRNTYAHALATAGIDASDVWAVVGSVGVVAAVLTTLQTLGRYSTRAEGHRIAALRYDSLEREMAATLAIPREARPRSDDALNGVRQRMDRYADESPTIRKGLWRRLEAKFNRPTTAPDPSRAAQTLVMTDT